jgi:hypothetical protein
MSFGLVALSPLAIAAGFFLGVPLLLPVLCAAPAYASMALLLREGRRGAALAAMLLWAFALGATMTGLCAGFPARGERVVIHGAAYWEEMHSWLETGEGRESDPSRFLPQHALHAGAFVALSLLTASTVSVVFGAILMNYMAYYVAQVVRLTPAHPLAAAILGWHPWSVVRIASFVTLGVLLAEPLLARLMGRPRPAVARGLLVLALAGLGVDALMKVLLAPHWAAILRGLR